MLVSVHIKSSETQQSITLFCIRALKMFFSSEEFFINLNILWTCMQLKIMTESSLTNEMNVLGCNSDREDAEAVQCDHLS